MTDNSALQWLFPNTLEGHLRFIGYYDSAKDWERAYQIWEHAEEILRDPPNESYLVDAITTLKRAVSHRLSILLEIYPFDRIPISEKPRRSLEQLGYWGIIRPTMLKRLIDIRNAVEHEDAQPPERERCLEFLDFAWYFLRSTDELTRHVPSDFQIRTPETTEPLLLRLRPDEDWSVRLVAWLPQSMVSANEIPGWVCLAVEHKKVRRVLVQELRDNKEELELHQSKNPDDVLLVARILSPENHIRRIIERCFSAAMLGCEPGLFDHI